jgi:hypothetical protein
MAWFNGNMLTRMQVVDALNIVFPDLHLQWDDLEIIDDAWTIDGTEPLEWCWGAKD